MAGSGVDRRVSGRLPTGPNGAAAHDAVLDILTTKVESHDITSRALDRSVFGPEGGGAPAYRLLLAVPRGQAPAGGWPILYMLDGNAAFDFLSPDLLARHTGLMVAGIGYDTDKQFARSQRTQDYSPPETPESALVPDPHHPGRLAGGAARFLDRLTGALRQEVEGRRPIDPARRTLWGHSFGGLCALYCALTQGEAFARYAIISPSIWWNEALCNRLVSDATAPDAPARVYLALGDREKRTGSPGPAPSGPAPVTTTVAEALRRRPGFDLRLEVDPGLIHIETLPASFCATFEMASA